MRPSPIDFLRHIQLELLFLMEQSLDVDYKNFSNHPLLVKAFIQSFEIIKLVKIFLMNYVTGVPNLTGKALRECVINRFTIIRVWILNYFGMLS